MPEWLNSLRLRLRALTRRQQLEQDLHDEMAVVVRRPAVSALLERCHIVEPSREIGLVATPADHPPRAVRRLEVSGEVGVRSHDRMAEADPAAARVLPSWIPLDVRTKGVLPVPPLVDRVDDPSALSGADDPCAALNPEVTALDLDDHDADAWHQDDEVELMVLLLVSEPDVGEHRPVVAALLEQGAPDLALGLCRELRIVRDAARRHDAIVASPCDIVERNRGTPRGRRSITSSRACFGEDTHHREDQCSWVASIS